MKQKLVSSAKEFDLKEAKFETARVHASGKPHTNGSPPVQIKSAVV
jgi:hypothetical protein